MNDIIRTSNEKLIDDFAAAVRSEYANGTPYTRRELDETRAALLAERNTIETFDPRGYVLIPAAVQFLIEAADKAGVEHVTFGVMDPKAGLHPDLPGYIGIIREDVSKLRDSLKANSCVCGEPNSPGTHRTDGPCLAPIGDRR